MMLVNWSRFVAWLLPVRNRTASVHAFISSFVEGVIPVYTELATYEEKVKYRMEHTSQVWSIEKVLNDHFDPSLRRIRIDDAGGDFIQPLFPDSDLAPIILNDDSLPPAHILQGDSGYEGGAFDFVVVLPYEYSEGDKYHIRSWINFYKTGGKRYDLKT